MAIDYTSFLPLNCHRFFIQFNRFRHHKILRYLKNIFKKTLLHNLMQYKRIWNFPTIKKDHPQKCNLLLMGKNPVHASDQST